MPLFESFEKKMIHAMLMTQTPKAGALRKLFALADEPHFNPIQMLDYQPEFVEYPRSQAEMVPLMLELRDLHLPLAMVERAGYLYADLSRILPYRQVLEGNVLKPDFPDPGAAWMLLVKCLWKNKDPLARVDIYLEGYEVQIFVDGQKVKKVFIRG